MRVVFVIIVVVVFACKNIKSDKRPGEDSATVKSDNRLLPTNANFTNDTVITIRFPKDNSGVTVTGKLNGINKPVTVIIPVLHAGELSALLTTEDPIANIRIDQILMPDGKADGPFGRRLVRKISKTGTYKLIISENQMQGDEWKGKFMLKLAVH